MGVTHYRPAFPSRAYKRLPLLFLATLALYRCDFFDIFPPEIEIVTPKEGTSYFATLPVEVKATDNRKVTKVEVFLDGESVHEFTKSPYKTDISLDQYSAASVNLKAIAHDKAGNSAEASLDVNVTIGLRLTAPNGGESWPEHSAQTITWESSGNVGSTVSLHYSINGGDTWDEITGSTAYNGTYAWTLPNFIETQSACKIKVATSQYADESDDTFTINAEPNTLTLTSPSGGETWPEQSTQTITWTSSGDVGDYVGLDYLLNRDATWIEIVASTANNGSYSWTLPNLNDTHTSCCVMVTSNSTSHFSQSDANFTISAEPNYITVTSPNGGEVWAEQSTQTITWSYSGDVGDHVSLGYSIDGGTNWTEIIASTSNDGSHTWNIPNFLDTQSACRVRVASTSTAFVDTSDADFTITTEPNYISLTSPNGGEVWAEQSTHNITWSKNGDVGDYVGLTFSFDGGTTWQVIVVSTENDGLYSWVLPNFLETSTTCRVKIASTSTSFADTSNTDFTITAELNYITLTSPNGGETWAEQSTHDITWTRSGDVGSYVSLHYSTNGGSTWTQIIASTSNDGSHPWTLPNLFETAANCRVIVSSTSTSFADTSAADFTITAEPNYITLISPDGGEVWPEQTNQSITWDYSGDVGNSISLDYSLDGGASWNQIAATIPVENQQHTWSLPNLLETKTSCRVRVLSTSTIFGDTSTADFTITGGEIAITAPNGGESWREWSDQTITWTSSGDVGANVSLHYSQDGGAPWMEITSSTPNNGSYQWTVPMIDADHANCLVRVSSTSTNYYDDSDADFTLTNWAPIFKGSWNTPGFARGVYVSGGYAYMADGANSGLQVINISNPTSPAITGDYETPDESYRVFVLGSYAYVADGYSGLQIINISNPANPTLIGSIPDPDDARDVFVVGNYAYVVARSYDRLYIINVSNPASPALTDSYEMGSGPYGVFVSGSYAYVADASGGLYIINVSNPANPTLAGTYNTPGSAHGVFVSGSYAYVADYTSGLQIINISNPASSTLTGAYDTPGDAEDVFVSGSYAYVADRSSGLQIIDISDPTNIILTGSYDTPGDAWGIFVSGGYAYVADGGAGLLIFDVSGLP